MMRNIVVLALACFCLASAASPTQKATKEYAAKQKLVYELFWHVYQPTVVHPEHNEKAISYKIADNIENYTNKEAVTSFIERYKHGMLPRGRVSSTNYDAHREETIALFKLFYYTKDFDTLYKTALWAKYHINEYVYVYALWVAIYHHPETRYVNVPPLYEIAPYNFFNSEVIREAQYIKMAGKSYPSVDVVDGVRHYIVQANYSGWYTAHDHDDEEHLSYFTEDIGMNLYYATTFHDFPSWMKTDEFNLYKGIKGTFYLYGHQQILARYYLERLSNGYGEIEDFDWNRPFVIGYHPTMTSPSSLPFPSREHYSNIPHNKYKYVQTVQDLESRINFAIDSGFVLSPDHKFIDIYTPEGLEILGNIIEGNADSINPQFYGSVDRLARRILGFNPEPISKHEIYPSALELYTTSMRDPAFYRLFKRITNFYLHYKSHLPPYSHDELAFPGVKIESVEVDKLLTYFDYFDVLLNNVVGVESPEDAKSFNIKARQLRLNHKPFSYHINIKSKESVKAEIRVFIGPKYDEHGREVEIDNNYYNFFELDEWIVQLEPGVNKIERSSQDSLPAYSDPVSSDIRYKEILKTVEGGEGYTYDTRPAAYPDRLMLPKGKKEGMPFQLFIYVSYVDKVVSFSTPGFSNFENDGKAFGFPLDRPVKGYNFTGPNIYFKDVMIYHKET